MTFTDLDGVSHTIHDYNEAGYKVLLDFSYEYCGPCYDWSVNVGHDLWEEHGPDGDNTIRMFHFDIDPRSDEDVLSYTQEWGVEYPVINLQADLPEYPLEYFPTLHFVCPDSTYNSDFGYSYPISYINANYLLSQCTDNPIPDSNITFVSASPALSNTMCNSTPLTYNPSLYLSANEALDSPIVMDQFYNVEIFINDTLFSTVNIDPDSDGSIGSFDEPVLSAIEVGFNDEITMVAHYPGDNYSADDTVRVTIPAQLFTPSSSDTSFQVLEEDVFFYVLNSEDSLVFDSSEENLHNFSVPEDSCYSIVFYNTHLYTATLKDGDGNIILSVESGEFEGYNSPRLFFNASDSAIVQPADTTSISENSIRDQLLSVSYFDLLGRQHFGSNKSNLPRGLYIEIKHYKSGLIESKKFYLD